MASPSGVSVEVKYWINSDATSEEPTKHNTFSVENVEPARLGLPEGQEPSKPKAGDYKYSGMHDHGSLIPPKEDGDMAQLVGCVLAAKQFSDEYLTQVIEEEKQAKAGKAQQSKKAKTSLLKEDIHR